MDVSRGVTQQFRMLVFILLLVAMPSCSDRVTEPEAIQTMLHEIPGCISHGAAKASSIDSCFAYTFTENLDITWCLPANCCPDSQRFVLSSAVTKDTITVTVADTARNLCRCNCSYNVHAQFFHLPLDHYVFLVRYGDSLFYNEDAVRSR
jgi:hypothetical protein